MSTSENDTNLCGACQGIVELTPGSVSNPPGLSALAYRVGTHGTFKQTMKAVLSSRPTLTDLTTRDDDDPSVALLDACAVMLDVLTFYQERIANEGYLRTATERRSVLELAREIGYELGPGVAASTYLAFILEEAQGAPGVASIGVGTKVQSLPGQDEKPQIFETVEAIEARKEWNALKPKTKEIEIPVYGHKDVYLSGASLDLKPGDGLLFIGAERITDPGSERWDFRRVKDVIVDKEAGYTRATWDDELGWHRLFKKVLPAKVDFKVYVFRQVAFLFGYNAPDSRNMTTEVRNRYGVDPNNEWSNFTIGNISYGTSPPADIDTVYLDALYPKILKDSWLVLSTPTYQEVYQVDTVAESSRRAFTLTAKTTVVKLKGENLGAKFNDKVRETVVFAQNEELELAEKPIADPVQGDSIVLDKRVEGLEAKRTLIVSGRRIRAIISSKAKGLALTSADGSQTVTLSPGDSLIVQKTPELLATGQTKWTLLNKNGFSGSVTVGSGGIDIAASEKDDATVSEVAVIKEVVAGSDPTSVVLKTPLANSYDRATVTIYANVARATHGETKSEVLGSGDASQSFQKFTLKQTPLTYVSAATASGAETTLEVRVNDVLWDEVSSLYESSARDRAYIMRRADDGKVTVQFGDGVNGTRLPTGSENVRATYRVGTGTFGMVKAGQLSLLMTRLLGVQKAVNPLAPTGAADPEKLDQAKQNAPVTVLTLGRIVSLQDFEDFARAFAGIGKAQATWLWDGERRVVHLTVAADASNGIDYTLDPKSDLYKNLCSGIDSARDTTQRVQVDSYEPLYFKLEAKILVDPAYIADNVISAVTAKLQDAYSFAQRSFGQSVTESELLAVMQGMAGVKAAFLNKLYLRGSTPTTVTPLPAKVARWEGDHIKPAQLLLLDENGATVTEKKS